MIRPSLSLSFYLTCACSKKDGEFIRTFALLSCADAEPFCARFNPALRVISDRTARTNHWNSCVSPPASACRGNVKTPSTCLTNGENETKTNYLLPQCLEQTMLLLGLPVCSKTCIFCGIWSIDKKCDREREYVQIYIRITLVARTGTRNTLPLKSFSVHINPASA